LALQIFACRPERDRATLTRVTTSWDLFDRLADRYDEVVPFFAGFAEELVRLLAVRPGIAILDVGTGRGAIAGAALQAGCRVVAVDPAARMIELVAARYPGVGAQMMNGQDLDFADSTFDLAIAGFVLHLVDDPDLLLAEMRRVVRPGGQVALTVPGRCAEDDGRWADYNALVAEFQLLAADTQLGRPVEVAQALHSAGFTHIKQASIEVHLPVLSPQVYWDFAMSHGFAGLVEALAPADAAELQRRAFAELTRMHDRGGIVIDRGANVHLARVPG